VFIFSPGSLYGGSLGADDPSPAQSGSTLQGWAALIASIGATIAGVKAAWSGQATSPAYLYQPVGTTGQQAVSGGLTSQSLLLLLAVAAFILAVIFGLRQMRRGKK
jgi:hypothetical protein